VISMFPVREFEKGGRSGKVVNFIVADATSNIRVVLWDTNHIAIIEKGRIKQGDVVEISNATMRESELHLGGFSEIKKSEVEIGEVKTEMAVMEKEIAELQQGQQVRVRGIVVNLFNPRFFTVCSECGKKVTQEADGYVCAEHGKVQCKERSLINFVLDDGTETIRVVLFSDEIAKLIPEEDLKDSGKLISFREDFLGGEIYVNGTVKKNQLFNNLEITGREVEKVGVEKLIEQLEGGG